MKDTTKTGTASDGQSAQDTAARPGVATRSDRMRRMTPQDFIVLGMDHIAYVNRELIEGKPIYVIHAADGSPVAMAENRDLAFAAVAQNGLDPVSVH